MANYDTVIPATLDVLDRATPDGTEDAAKLDDAIRQAKSTLIDVILNEHNADGSHKSTAASLDANSVTGDKISSSATDDTQRAIGGNWIKDGSITTAKILDANVTLAKLAAASVDNSKITDNTISGAKITDGSIATVKLAALSVGAALIADNSIGSTKIVDAAVTAAKIQDGAVSAPKIALASGRIIVGDGNNKGVECIVGGNVQVQLDLTTNPATAKFNVAVGESGSVPAAIIEEVGNFSVGIIAQTWFARPGGGAAYSELKDLGDLVSISGGTITFRSKGTYLIRGFVNFYCQAGHQARLLNTTSGSNTVLSDGSVCQSTTLSMCPSHFEDIVTVPLDNTTVIIQSFLGQITNATSNPVIAGSGGINRQVAARLSIIKIG